MPLIPTNIAEVAALLRTRTKDHLGNELGDFTENTRPTAEQVEKLLSDALRRVVSAIGTSEPCNTELAEDAASVVHLRTAMLVELSYFSEQINTNRSPYRDLKELYDSDVKQLIEAIHETCGTGIGPAGSESGMPSYNYGRAPLIGKRTLW